MATKMERRSIRKVFSSDNVGGLKEEFEVPPAFKAAARRRLMMKKKSTLSTDETEEESQNTEEDTSTASPRRSISRKPKLLPKNSANEGIVKEFMKCINNQDLDGCKALLKSPQQCEWRFSGKVNTTIKQCIEMIQNIMNSFPDFSIKCKKIVEVGPGVVQVKHAVMSGTHTGEAFGFQCYQPLQASGTKCINDPENLTFFMCDDKIVQVHVVCTGDLCGPVGLHTQSKNGKTNPSAKVRESTSPVRATAA